MLYLDDVAAAYLSNLTLRNTKKRGMAFGALRIVGASGALLVFHRSRMLEE